MGITNILENLGVKEKIIKDSIQTIISNSIEDINEHSISAFNTSELKLSVLSSFKALAHDKSSTLGQFIQKQHNPKIDKVLSMMGITMVPKNFSDFKKEYKKLVTSESITKLDKDNDGLNKFIK